MNFTITISGESSELNAALKTLNDVLAGTVSGGTVKVDADKQAKATKQEAAVSEEKPAKAGKGKKEETPGVTIEEVRAVMNELTQAGKRAEVKSLLADVGAGKLSDVDPTRYQELIDAAKELLNDDELS